MAKLTMKAAFRRAQTCELKNDRVQAKTIYEAILRVQPNNAKAKGALLSLTGAAEIAVVEPSKAEIGEILELTRQKKYHEVIKSAEELVRRFPDAFQPWFTIGYVSRVLRQYGKAEEAFRKAVAVNPAHVNAHRELARTLQDLGKADEAADCFARLVKLKPGSADDLNSWGVALKNAGLLEQARESFRQALEVDAKHSQAHYNVGTILKAQGKLDEAVASYGRALNARPEHALARAEKLHHQLHMCDWTAFQDFSANSDLGLVGDAVPPFLILPFEDDPARQAARTQRFARQYYSRNAEPLEVWSGQRSGRIRIGYFSADFFEHATLHLTAGLFRLHDKNRFEVFAFSYGPARTGTMRDQVRAHMDHFLDVGKLSDPEIVRLARGHSLDIAIDLKGFTGQSRSQLFAYRLAPVQINFLGYPGSMGAEFIDYIIADRVVTPEEERGHYSEKVIYLPNSYQPNDDQRAIAQAKTTRGDFSLPETAFVFCCFNSNYKIGPREFDIWMRLLRAVEGSVLWLLRSNEWAEQNLRREAISRGVDPDRLVFAGKLPHSEHLARHKHADLFLDTFNVNAHTTASDALWAGLPLVTKVGRQFAARVGASLLTAAGIPDLIADSEKDYEALILDLATNRDRLTSVRSNLARDRLNMPLFDTAQYTRDFERALEQAHAGRLVNDC